MYGYAADVEPETPRPGETVHYQHDSHCELATVLDVTDGQTGELNIRLNDTHAVHREVKYSQSRIGCWHFDGGSA